MVTVAAPVLLVCAQIPRESVPDVLTLGAGELTPATPIVTLAAPVPLVLFNPAAMPADPYPNVVTEPPSIVTVLLEAVILPPEIAALMPTPLLMVVTLPLVIEMETSPEMQGLGWQYWS
jgi:hypothetical protein